MNDQPMSEDFYQEDCDCLCMTPDGGCWNRPGRCTIPTHKDTNGD